MQELEGAQKVIFSAESCKVVDTHSVQGASGDEPAVDWVKDKTSETTKHTKLVNLAGQITVNDRFSARSYALRQHAEQIDQQLVYRSYYVDAAISYDR